MEHAESERLGHAETHGKSDNEHAQNAGKGAKDTKTACSFPMTAAGKSTTDRIVNAVAWGALFIGLSPLSLLPASRAEYA